MLYTTKKNVFVWYLLSYGKSDFVPSSKD